ncbi:MAG: Rpp14/Pop5 family protein [Natrialbaceae archaeon]|nr:Rpp14/Pop5 family protein [Natrialbaceae archaeon]
MKHLPKHLRPRWRYLVVELEAWPDAAIDRRSFQAAIWQATRRLLGDAGSAAIGLEVHHFEYDRGGGVAIVRVRRGTESRARAAIASLSRVDDEPVGLRVRGASGTLRRAREKYLGRDGQNPVERTVAFDNEDRVAVVRNDVVDVRLEDHFTGATDLDLG